MINGKASTWLHQEFFALAPFIFLIALVLVGYGYLALAIIVILSGYSLIIGLIYLDKRRVERERFNDAVTFKIRNMKYFGASVILNLVGVLLILSYPVFNLEPDTKVALGILGYLLCLIGYYLAPYSLSNGQ